MKRIYLHKLNKKGSVCSASFFLCIFLFIEESFSTTISMGGGLNDDDTLARVSIVKIIPYDPLKYSVDADVEAAVDESLSKPLDEYHTEPLLSGTLGDEAGSSTEAASGDGSGPWNIILYGTHRRRFREVCRPPSYTLALYKNHFGFGRNFVYSTEGADQFLVNTDQRKKLPYEEGSHGWCLQKLVQSKRDHFKADPVADPYHPLKSNKNLLLARIAVTGVEGTKSGAVEYFFGVFVSGSASDGDNKVGPFSMFGTKDEVLKKLAPGQRVNSFTHKLPFTCKLPIEHVFEKAVDELVAQYSIGQNVYGVKPFPLLNLVPVARPKSSDLKILMEKRLFGNALPATPKDVRRFLEDREVFSYRAFGVPSYIDMADPSGDVKQACFGTGCAIFNQSEQTFLSFLEGNEGFPEEVDLSCATEHVYPYNKFKHFPDPAKITSDVKLFLYSTLDICLYCRGTFSYLLQNEGLKTKIESFFQKNKVNLEIGKLEVYAFSNEETNI